MSFARKQATISFSVWLVTFIFFSAAFFLTGADSFADQDHKASEVTLILDFGGKVDG